MICSDRNDAEMVPAPLMTIIKIVDEDDELGMTDDVAVLPIVQIIPSLFCDFLARSRHRQS